LNSPGPETKHENKNFNYDENTEIESKFSPPTQNEKKKNAENETSLLGNLVQKSQTPP
jgi:hypothetical protein